MAIINMSHGYLAIAKLRSLAEHKLYSSRATGRFGVGWWIVRKKWWKHSENQLKL